jgi:cyclic pyranopterin phosphate synthase
LRDLALTTNGLLLAEHATALETAGLGRVTVSLDTLDAERFARLTRSDRLEDVLAGIRAAAETFGSLKIDSVIMRGVNDDELLSLIELGRTHRAEVRFIEYMDVGGATRWSPGRVVSRREMLETLARHYGPITPVPGPDSAPAQRFALPGGTIFGIISSTTEPFCANCDRSRLTADGVWYRCLYASAGFDLRGPLRRGASPEEIAAIIAEGWKARTDRGAEERLALGDRRAFVPIGDLRDLKRDPHLEMHTRGG